MLRLEVRHPVAVQRQPYHHGNLSQAIIDESTRLIESKGLNQFSLAAVARSLGVSSGSPYHHFKDADEVLRRVADQAYTQMFDRVRAAAAVAMTADELDAQTLRAAVAAACHEFLQYSMDHPVLFRMSVAEYRPASESDPFQVGRDFMKDSLPLLTSSGLIASEHAEEFRSATYVVLRGVAAAADEAPRLVAGSGHPHELLDRLLNALFVAFGPHEG